MLKFILFVYINFHVQYKFGCVSLADEKGS